MLRHFECYLGVQTLLKFEHKLTKMKICMVHKCFRIHFHPPGPAALLWSCCWLCCGWIYSFLNLFRMDLSTCWQNGFISTSRSTQTATEVHVLDSHPDIFLSFPPFSFQFHSLFLASVGTKVNQVWELGCSFPGFVHSRGESDCCAVWWQIVCRTLKAFISSADDSITLNLCAKKV